MTDTTRAALDECTREIDELHAELASLAYALSHEMRSPVRVIDAFAEALAEDYAARLDAEGQEHLQRIRDAARQMDRYIRGIVSLAGVAKAEIA
ncbi:MAG TPA: histidine kinase dimerization/phospho-acceptor domain-containing protein, partial [Thermoanaerobaculia bacterium]